MSGTAREAADAAPSTVPFPMLRAARAARAARDVGVRLWAKRPPLTIRTRLTLTYATLFTLGGGLLVLAMTTVCYRLIFAPLHHTGLPGSLDPDHDGYVGATDQLRDAAASRLLRVSLVLLLIVVLVSALVGRWVAGRMLRPLAAITAAARRASGNTLHERLDLPGPTDELKELGDTFDAMLERLDAAFAAQRRFVANASHELRTPLTLTRTAVEVTLAKPAATADQWRSMAHDVAEATDQAQRLISALLLLARSEQGPADAAPEDDDLADIAAEALDQARARPDARTLRITADLAPAPVRGNVALLAIAAANLLENAVAYNRPGGVLELATGTDPGGSAWLTVANDGAPIPAAETARLLEPFHRGPRTRTSAHVTGAGLGLSIVQAVARAHAATLTPAPRPQGGLTLTLRLPPP